MQKGVKMKRKVPQPLISNIVPGQVAPVGAQYKWGTDFYKVGRFGRLYKWWVDDWIRTTLTIEELAGYMVSDSKRIAARH